MKRYVLEVSYDGTCFHGSQLQGDLPTVQLALNQALTTLLREAITTFGASRTDEGVHALANYYHFDTEKPVTQKLLYNLNAILPHSLSVKSWLIANSNDFNARFDASSRTYRYRIYHQKQPFYHQRAFYYPFQLDRNSLNETAALIQQYTDFESFCKRNSQAYTFLCTILESRWEQSGDQLHYIVSANRFLRGMVRGLVSTQLQVARGRYDLKAFKKIIEAKDCTQADFSVPGHGLYLEGIEFPKDSFSIL